METPKISQQLQLTDTNSRRLKSKRWRLENLYWIRNKDGELVKFQLNYAQLHYYYNRHTSNVIAKARQLGFTTFHVIDYLDDCFFGRRGNAVNVAIIADTLRNVRVIFEKVSLAWQYFPYRHLISANTENKNELAFTNGSKVIVTPDARSGTYQDLHVSELAKIDKKFPQKSDDIVSGSLPAVPLTGCKSIEATGNGDSGNFYDIVKEARMTIAKGRKPYKQEWKLFFYPWTLDPNYQIFENIPLDSEAKEYMQENNLTSTQARFWQMKRKELKQYIFQEFPTTIDECFISAEGYYDIDRINTRIKFVRKPCRAGTDWVMWKEPEKGRQYVLGGDVAEGYGGDSSTIEVLDKKTGEQVYEFCSNSIKVDQYARKVYEVGKMYNWAVAGIERNNHGLAVLMLLSNGVNTSHGKRPYPNIYKQKTIDRSNNKPVYKLGWHTNSMSKPLMMDELDIAFSDDVIKINSVPLLIEMRDFTSDDLTVKTIQQSKITSRHYDRLIGMAICWQMMKERGRMQATKEQIGM